MIKQTIVSLLVSGLMSFSACSDDDACNGVCDAGLIDTIVFTDAGARDSEAPQPDAAKDAPGGDAGGDAGVDAMTECKALALTHRRSRVMFLLDQSSSMLGAQWSGSTSHWEEVGGGLAAMLATDAAKKLDIGLDAFPDGEDAYYQSCYDSCCANPVCRMTQMIRCMTLSTQCTRGCAVDLPPVVSLAEYSVSAPAINDYLALSYLPPAFSSTPLVAQLAYYAQEGPMAVPALYAGDGASYLLVISDGEDTCFDQSDSPDYAAIRAELARLTQELVATHGLKVIAIGFGDTSGEMAAQLNAIAANGGTSFTSFLPIEEAGTLSAALDSVVASVPRCVYELDDVGAAAPDAEVTLLGDGAVIPYQEPCVDGWHWAPGSSSAKAQVEFCGGTCDGVVAGTIAQIAGRYACGGDAAP